MYSFLVTLWLLVFGPLWLLGWCILRITKRLNQLAAYWCRFLMLVFPRR
jgi:hypothetical protein